MKIFKKTIIRGCESRGDHNSKYLVRYTLIECKYFKLCIHIFYRSDADELHDHPWNFWTFILWRGYNEEVMKIKREGNEFNYEVIRETNIIKPLRLYYRNAIHSHRVILHNNKKAVTLVLMGKYIRHWGFWTSGGWLKWDTYFKDNGC